MLEHDTDAYQDPDKYIAGEGYWFFKYFAIPNKVDIIDIQSPSLIHKLESKLKFYILQGIKAFRRQNEYDIIMSHGAQSGVFLALLRRIFGNGNAKHIIFDIGGMNGAKKSGFSTKLIQFAMKSNPYIVCHSTNIISNIQETYPWLTNRTRFIHFGVGMHQYKLDPNAVQTKNIFVFAGKKRDESTVISSWKYIVDNNKDSGFVLNMIGSKNDYDIPSCNTIRWLNYQEYINQLEQAAFVILPLAEYKYSYGQMSLLGSMAMGKYVITTDVTGISDYTRLCKTVKVVPVGNVDLLADCILQYIDKDTLSKDRSLPRREVAELFDERTMASNIESFIKDILFSECYEDSSCK